MTKLDRDLSQDNESQVSVPSLRGKAKGAFSTAMTQAKSVATSTKDVAAHAAGKAAALTKRTAALVGDLNGDGKVDDEDLKIAVSKGRKAASVAIKEVGELAKETLKSDLVKDVAAGAAVGAVIAVPVPIVGPATGAVIGGTLAAYKNFTKK